LLGIREFAVKNKQKPKDKNMSMATLEREILAQAKIAVKNPKLKMKDVLEWSTGDVKPQDGEVAIRLDNPGCNICILKISDKRAA
jgi:hypothetical protein